VRQISESPPPSDHAAAIRQRLLTSARAAFARFGHDDVNLRRDILDPAGVSIDAFYLQFRDKTELLLEILAISRDGRRRATIDALDGGADSVETGVPRLVRSFFESLDNPEHAWRIQMNERSSAHGRIRDAARDGREQWIDELAALFGQWSDAPASACRQAAFNLVGQAIGIATHYVEDPPRSGREELVVGAGEYAVAGVTAVLRRSPR